MTTPTMKDSERYQNRLELLQGTLDMLILRAIQQQPMHGYGIAQIIRSRSSEALSVETESLYPAVHRLEQRKWVRSEWKVTESRQRAKFYQPTPLGKKQLALDHRRWLEWVRAIGDVMKADGVQA